MSVDRCLGPQVDRLLDADISEGIFAKDRTSIKVGSHEAAEARQSLVCETKREKLRLFFFFFFSKNTVHKKNKKQNRECDLCYMLVYACVQLNFADITVRLRKLYLWISGHVPGAKISLRLVFMSPVTLIFCLETFYTNLLRSQTLHVGGLEDMLEVIV